ncbi:MAG: hypothetical protein PHW74_14815 [Desulfobacca sp.]|nr:hypothetical protein [Desulfobacca sp.]
MPIIIRMDAGFFDQKLMPAFDDLGLGVICSGRIYEEIQDFADRAPNFQWRRYQNRQQGGVWLSTWLPRLCGMRARSSSK